MFADRNGTFHPVIDRDAAIRNMGGMVWLYEKHLSRFRDTYSDSPERVMNLLNNEKKEEARILIHSVKGLSGTLGLIQLYYAASILDRAIISSDPSLYDSLDIYRNRLCEALSSDINE